MTTAADAAHRMLLDLNAQYRAQVETLVQQTEASLFYDWQRGMAAAPHLYQPLLDRYAAALNQLRLTSDDPAAALSLDWLTNQNPLLASIEQSVKASAEQYAQDAAAAVEHGQQVSAPLGEAMASELTQAALFPASEVGVDPAMLFNRPNPDAIASFVGRAGDGHPLGDLFSNFGAEATTEARKVLATGLLLGQNPLAMTAGLSQAMGISRSRAAIIARTEILGSYRYAAHETYRANSDVLGYWLWSAGGASPCAMCMGMDGTLHDLNEDLSDHPCGKCAPLPVTKSWDDILGPLGIDTSDLEDTSLGAPGAYETGEEKFARMSPEQQRAIIGTNTGYEAYRRGEVTLRDFVGVRPAEHGFPSSYYQKSLKELQIPTRQARRLVEPRADLLEKYAAGKLRYSDLGKLTPDELMPAWAKQSESSRIVYQILRNGLPYDLTAHEQGLLIVNLEQMLKGELPLNVRAAAERQLLALGQTVERQTVGAAAKGVAETAEQAAARELEQAAVAREATAAVSSGELPDVQPTAEFVEMVHANQQSDIEWFADMHGMSVAEYEQAVTAKLAEDINAGVISVRTSEANLEQILDAGRIKTVHETHLTSVEKPATWRDETRAEFQARIDTYIGSRAKYEAEAFGYPLDMPAALRPVSGYIAPLTEDDAAARGFGEARMVLKDGVRDRSTFTVGDSLGNANSVPEPVNAPSYDAYPFMDGKEKGVDRERWASLLDPLTENNQFGRIQMSYMEAQIHGGLNTSDIAEIIFNDGNYPSLELQLKLADAGIPWRMESDVKGVM